MKNFICFIALVFGFTEVALAQNWQQTNGPASNYIRSILFNKSGDIFLVSEVTHRSTDQGISWQSIGEELPYGIIDLVISQTGDLFAADGNASGIWRSQDKGNTWTKVFNVYSCMSLIASPDNSIHISANATSDGIGWSVATYRSLDNGLTWDSSYITSPNITAVWASGADKSGNLFHCTTGAIYRSTNKGTSWSKIINGLPELDFRQISFAPNGNIYTVGSPYDYNTYGLYRSTDGGRTWSRVPFGFPGEATSVSSCAVDGKGRLLACAGPNPSHYSDDNGETWHDYAGGSGGNFIGAPDSGFYQGDIAGISKSTSPSSGWNVVPVPIGSVAAIVSHPDGTIVASCSPSDNYTARIWHSTDQGTTWSHAFDIDAHSPNPNFALHFAPTAYALDSSLGIIAGNDGYTFRSTNSGIHWDLNTVKLTDGILTSMVVRPDGYVFASSSIDGVFRSSDNGSTWDQLNDGLSNKNIYSLAVNQTGVVFAGDDKGIISRTTDNGFSWQQVFSDTSKGKISSIVVSLQGNVIAGKIGVGMYQSTDNGNTWSQLGTGLPTNMINTLLVTPSGNIFTGTDSGVFQLLTGSTAWQPYNLGLTTKNVLSLTRNTNGNLFAGTAGSGVFSSIQTFNSIQSNAVADKSPINDIAIAAIFPNPAYGNTAKLSFSEVLPEKVQFSVVDVLGTEVFHSIIIQGIKNFDIPVGNLTEGVYYARIELNGKKVTNEFVKMK
jgi:photosystem II stability/assembly factor-like uncharacterized protein